MKYQLLFLQLLLINSALAQDWMPFRKGIDFLYKVRNNDLFYVNIDSAKALGADSVWYFDKTMNDINNWDNTDKDCDTNLKWNFMYKIKGENLFGSQMISEGIGGFALVTDSLDTFRIKTLLPPNQTWIFNRNISAEIVSRDVQTVVGEVDSVLKIRLSDAREMVISKRFGLVKGFQLTQHKMIGDSANYQSLELVGIPVLNKGIGGINFEKVFDFQVGDRFGYLGNNYSGIAGLNTTKETSKSFLIVLEKTPNYPNSVSYKMARTMYHSIETIPPGMQSGTIRYSIIKDTVSVSYNISNYLFLFQTFPNRKQYYVKRFTTNAWAIKKMKLNSFWFVEQQWETHYLQNYDSCKNIIGTIFSMEEYASNSINTYANRLGMIYSFWNEGSLGYGNGKTNQLICFQSADFSFGNCDSMERVVDSLIATKMDEKVIENTDLKAYFNGEKLKVEIGDKIASFTRNDKIELYNLLGEKVATIYEGEMELELAIGVYILKGAIGNKVFVKKLVKL